MLAKRIIILGLEPISAKSLLGSLHTVSCLQTCLFDWIEKPLGQTPNKSCILFSASYHILVHETAQWVLVEKLGKKSFNRRKYITCKPETRCQRKSCEMFAFHSKEHDVGEKWSLPLVLTWECTSAMNHRRQKQWVSRLHGKGLLEREDSRVQGSGRKWCVYLGEHSWRKRPTECKVRAEPESAVVLELQKAVFNDVPDLAEPSRITSAIQVNQAEYN